MRIVFMGTPEFALPTLRRLIDSEHDVVAVYTQPDSPAGRGKKLTTPPVKTLALQNEIPVYQPESVSAPDEVARLKALAPDVGVVAAYGQILRQRVLDVPRLGILNVHASLLPRWRGAAPIPAAILAGDAETGATIMRIVRALDAGPMLGAETTRIAEDDTTATLTPRLAEVGAELLLRLLPAWERGEITPEPQHDALATYAPQIRKEDALIDWSRESAVAAWRTVRAYNPSPMAYTLLDREPLRIIEAALTDDRSGEAPGTVVALADGAGVVSADGRMLRLVTVQAAGKQAAPVEAFVRGRRDFVGKVLGR